MTASLAFITHPGMLHHLSRGDHPERPDRLTAVITAVAEAGLIDASNPMINRSMHFGVQRDEGPRILELQGEPVDEQWLQLVHDSTYIERVRRVTSIGGVLDQGDTPVGPGSFEAAKLAVGCLLRGVDAVMTGEAKRAFAAVRPPGHHAEHDRPMGFCLFSNVAVAARYLQKKYNIGKVAIVDFDVHHGNGTQEVFERDPTVFFCSLHQDPRTLYPGSGYDWEMGLHEGHGQTLNIPMHPLADDATYLHTITDRLLPALEKFQPEVLLISAGFDAHRDDPLAHIELSEAGFEQITAALVAFADANCRGRVISTLEGGYNLLALGRSVVRHLAALRG